MSLQSKLEYARILLAVSELPLEVLNEKIAGAEKLADAAIDKAENFEKLDPLISLTINKDRTYAEYVKAAIGLYVTPGYVQELGAYTSRFAAKFLLFYKIRDNFFGYYTFLAATVKKDVVSLKVSNSYNNPFFQGEVETIKEYANGRIDLKASPELLEIIEIAKKIDGIFNPKEAKV